MTARRLALTSSTAIPAAPERVWDVLTDAERWPGWCGPVRAVHRIPARWEPGEALSYTLAMGPGVPVRFDVVLDRVEPGAVLAWSSTKWWGVRGARTFTLEPADGSTRVRDEKVFESGLWPVGWLYPRATVRRMSEGWLRDLAAEVSRRS